MPSRIGSTNFSSGGTGHSPVLMFVVYVRFFTDKTGELSHTRKRMWARKIDNSAKEFGKLLLPEQTDREMTLPLAALAIRSGKGRIALQSRKGVAGAWFPVSPAELPAPRSDREADIVRALENVLIAMAAELHIRADQIRRVYGLAPAQP